VPDAVEGAMRDYYYHGAVDKVALTNRLRVAVIDAMREAAEHAVFRAWRDAANCPPPQHHFADAVAHAVRQATTARAPSGEGGA
jgi:hypothetical protein